jgi:hypothetical protein
MGRLHMSSFLFIGKTNCISDLEVSDIQSVLVVVAEDAFMCAEPLCVERYIVRDSVNL